MTKQQEIQPAENGEIDTLFEEMHKNIDQMRESIMQAENEIHENIIKADEKFKQVSDELIQI